MRDDEQRAVLFDREVAEEVENLLAHLRVEVRGRLVGEKDRRASRKGARDRDTLLLPAGQIARQEVHPLA